MSGVVILATEGASVTGTGATTHIVVPALELTGKGDTATRVSKCMYICMHAVLMYICVHAVLMYICMHAVLMYICVHAVLMYICMHAVLMYICVHAVL